MCVCVCVCVHKIIIQNRQFLESIAYRLNMVMNKFGQCQACICSLSLLIKCYLHLNASTVLRYRFLILGHIQSEFNHNKP